jgi:methylenetetrahydrofolate reductase (NADPH)
LLKSRSNLERVLTTGGFAVTTEITPPKHSNGSRVAEIGKRMQGYVDSFNLTDNPAGVVRMSSLAASVILVQQGQDPVLHMTCRDRNRIGLQSDLLGAYALGVRNVLCLTGDHQRLGNHPTAKGVYDLDSINLICMVKQLRDKQRFMCGEECEVAPSFYIGCAANPFAGPFEYRVVRLEQKVKAGADFVQTQSVFDLEQFERFMEMVRARGLEQRVKIIAGVMPLTSAKEAAILQKIKPGMSIPDSIIARLENSADQKSEGLQICIEQIQFLRNLAGVAGIHIMARECEELVPFLVEAAGLLPRPQFLPAD